MKCAHLIKKLSIKLFLLLNFIGCAHFESIDREKLNRPSMSLQKNVFVQGQASLTNQKSNGGATIGACTVCAH